MKPARRLILVAPLLAGLVLAGLAPLAVRAADPAASAPIAALNQALIATMKSGKTASFDQRYAMLAPVVERAFELPITLQATIGPRWKSLPPPQQTALLDAFRRFTVSNYVAEFSDFHGEHIDVLPQTRSVGADQVVETQLVPPPGGPKTRIDYVMRHLPNGWRAVDVLLDGSISQAAVQRSDFRTSVHEGDASALITKLQHKAAELAGGGAPP